jgi:hypothetical protein
MVGPQAPPGIHPAPDRPGITAKVTNEMQSEKIPDQSASVRNIRDSIKDVVGGGRINHFHVTDGAANIPCRRIMKAQPI